MHAIPDQTSDFLAQRLDAARDLYLLALALGERGSHQFGSLIQEARLHFINVIEEARMAGLDTVDIQNMLVSRSLDLVNTIRPDLRDRLEELLRVYANPR
ncbi:MAG TPA: hypothetical protein VGQ48_00870 [Gemmatimonadales bacterium]|jgi:hypothetical protein|nr:hypothetical protein [Gemmatimonadales bacterium]